MASRVTSVSAQMWLVTVWSSHQCTALPECPVNLLSEFRQGIGRVDDSHCQTALEEYGPSQNQSKCALFLPLFLPKKQQRAWYTPPCPFVASLVFTVSEKVTGLMLLHVSKGAHFFFPLNSSVFQTVLDETHKYVSGVYYAVSAELNLKYYSCFISCLISASLFPNLSKDAYLKSIKTASLGSCCCGSP